jgi:hypothetical protein
VHSSVLLAWCIKDGKPIEKRDVMKGELTSDCTLHAHMYTRT